MCALQRCGFMVEMLVSDKSCKTFTKDSGEILEQDSNAAQMARLALALVGQRIRTLSMYWFVYPLPFFWLLHSDPARVQAALLIMKKDWEIWDTIRTLTTAFWKSVAKQSCFNFTLVDDIFKELAAVNFLRVPEGLYEVLCDLAKAFGSTNSQKMQLVVAAGAKTTTTRSSSALSTRSGKRQLWTKSYQICTITPRLMAPMPPSHPTM